MSRIALSPPASGTATFTLSAPATNTDRVLTLPDTTAPILAGSGITLSASAPANTLVTTAAGNVGIGTSSPDGKLRIESSGASNGTVASKTSLQLSTTNISSGFASTRIQWTYGALSNGTKSWIEGGVYGADYLAIGYGASEHVRFAAGGNVGIGTNSPQTTLHVAGTGVQVARVSNTGTGSADSATFDAVSSDISVGLFAYKFVGVGGVGTGSNHDFVLRTNATERMRLTATSISNATGQFSVNSTTYSSQSTIDVTGSQVTLANNGFIDMTNFSGVLFVNNHTTGGVSMYLCGGGSVVEGAAVSGGGGMSVTFNSGINGYTIQNLSGGTRVLGIVKFRTRQGA